MKTTKTNNTKTEQNVNPFASLLADTAETGVRRLDYTPVLQDKAHTRAVDLCKACTTTELQAKANKMMDTGVAADLIDLITSVYNDETIKADAKVLDDCPAEDLDKMLESQRSNRSKAKRSGLRTKLSNTVTYIASMYAELLIREKTGKAYNGSTQKIALDVDALKADPDLLKRKINSLASKKSRLSKLAEYDDSAAAELHETEAQLEELRALRPAHQRTAVKNPSVAELKKALLQLDPAELPENIRAIISKIG